MVGGGSLYEIEASLVYNVSSKLHISTLFQNKQNPNILYRGLNLIGLHDGVKQSDTTTQRREHNTQSTNGCLLSLNMVLKGWQLRGGLLALCLVRRWQKQGSDADQEVSGVMISGIISISIP